MLHTDLQYRLPYVTILYICILYGPCNRPKRSLKKPWFSFSGRHILQIWQIRFIPYFEYGNILNSYGQTSWKTTQNVNRLFTSNGVLHKYRHCQPITSNFLRIYSLDFLYWWPLQVWFYLYLRVFLLLTCILHTKLASIDTCLYRGPLFWNRKWTVNNIP